MDSRLRLSVPLLDLPMKPVRCPWCRLRIDGRYVWTHRNCPACAALFRIRRRYVWTIYFLALIVSSGIAFALGNRGTALQSLAVLLVLPTFWGMLMINLRLFPVDIELVRQGWEASDTDEDREWEREFELLRDCDAVVSLEESEALPPKLEDVTDDASGRPPLSTPRDPPFTLEGILIAIMLTALLAYHLYGALEPYL